MNVWKRRPPKIAEWVDAGGELPFAGRIHEALAAKGVRFGADGVSVEQDGTVVVVTEDSYQKVYPALDTQEPAAVVERAPSPEEQAEAARLNEARQTVRGAVASIGRRPANQRTETDEALVALATLLGIEGAPTAPTTPAPPGPGAR